MLVITIVKKCLSCFFAGEKVSSTIINLGLAFFNAATNSPSVSPIVTLFAPDNAVVAEPQLGDLALTIQPLRLLPHCYMASWDVSDSRLVISRL